MKWWYPIILVIGVLMVVGGALALIMSIDNPTYVPAEASAMVLSVYGRYMSSIHSEEYLGQGVWEVKGRRAGYPNDLIFRVYETSGTVQPYDFETKERLEYFEWLRRQSEQTTPSTTIPKLKGFSSTPALKGFNK